MLFNISGFNSGFANLIYYRIISLFVLTAQGFVDEDLAAVSAMMEGMNNMEEAR